MASELKSNKSIEAFSDNYFSPLSINSLCEYILLVCNRAISGTFNLGSRDGISKSDFIFFFGEACGYSVDQVKKIKMIDSSQIKTSRPKDMRMDCSKFEDVFSILLPSIEDEIKLIIGAYVEK